jgi:hypothetical protein
MVSDDPTNWELQRRLNQIWELINARIGRDEYAEYQRGVDRRYEEAGHDIDDLRHTHETDMAEMRLWVTQELAKIRERTQWRVTTMISCLTIFASVVGILVTIWLRKG